MAINSLTLEKLPRRMARWVMIPNQLLEAKGVSFGTNGCNGKRKSQGDRSLSCHTKIQFNCNLLVGMAYTGLLGLKPGDEFEIKLGRKQIRLIPAGGADEEE